MTDTKQTSRELLLEIGVDQWNATQVIPYMMIAPATIDPKAAQSDVLVRAVQRVLYGLGATDVANTGYLDQPTARAMEDLVGPGWERMSWGANVSALLQARRAGRRIGAAFPAPSAPMGGVPLAVGGTLDFLPDVPGGAITYGVVAYLIYRMLKGKKR